MLGGGQSWPVPGGVTADGADDEVGDQRGPACLVGGADTTAGVAVEVLVEGQQVVPVRVALEEVDVTEDRAAAAGVVEEDRNEDRAPRNQMAAWVSGPEITLPVTGAMDSVMAGLLQGWPGRQRQ